MIWDLGYPLGVLVWVCGSVLLSGVFSCACWKMANAHDFRRSVFLNLSVVGGWNAATHFAICYGNQWRHTSQSIEMFSFCLLYSMMFWFGFFQEVGSSTRFNRKSLKKWKAGWFVVKGCNQVVSRDAQSGIATDYTGRRASISPQSPEIERFLGYLAIRGYVSFSTCRTSSSPIFFLLILLCCSHRLCPLYLRCSWYIRACFSLF